MKYSKEFMDKLASVTNKRAQIVIKHILKHGYITTEELTKQYGYEHPPRAARDVREHGIPLETFWTKDSNGKKIGAYRFGDWEKYNKGNLLNKAKGRTVLSNALKQKLIEVYGCKCFIYNEEYPENLLQVDHRIPYEILGEQDEADLSAFMLLCPSANRAKSWACEHCSNWTDKKADICRQCYWAYPESYLHIAMEPERRIDILFRNIDILNYEKLKKIADKKGKSIQEVLKDYIKKL